MIIVKYLVISVVCIVSGEKCQFPCHCESGTANCTHKNLAVLPHEFSNTLRVLDISYNKIKHINHQTFKTRDIMSLENLNVSNNLLTEIYNTTFMGQDSLEEVDFSGNDLKKISPDAFKYPPKLKRLSLKNNKFLEIPENGPFLISSSLEVLNLENCSLVVFTVESFVSLTSLKELYLSHNNLERLVIDAPSFLPTLRILDLSYNYLQVVSEEMISFPNLEQLEIMHNTVKMIGKKNDGAGTVKRDTEENSTCAN